MTFCLNPTYKVMLAGRMGTSKVENGCREKSIRCNETWRSDELLELGRQEEHSSWFPSVLTPMLLPFCSSRNARCKTL